MNGRGFVVKAVCGLALVALLAPLAMGVASVQGGSAVETRLRAELFDADGMDSGKADFRSRDGRMRLSVEIEDMAANTAFDAFLNGAPLGSLVTDDFGFGDLNLDSSDGDAVPSVTTGDLVEVRIGADVVLSGTFGMRTSACASRLPCVVR